MHLYDAMGMTVSRFHPRLTTPEGLLEAMPSCKPVANLLAPTHYIGHYTINRLDDLLELKKSAAFDWDQLYHLPSVVTAGSASGLWPMNTGLRNVSPEMWVQDVGPELGPEFGSRM